MNSMQKQFQQYVQEMIDTGWFVASKTPTEVIFKETEEDSDDTIFTLLESETKQLLKKFPSIQTGMVTHFINHEEKTERVEHEWKFYLHQRKYVMRAFFLGPDFVNKRVDMSLHVATNNNYESMSHSILKPNEKIDLNAIYEQFKQMVVEFPRYRLHFLTQTISFQEEAVMGWLN